MLLTDILFQYKSSERSILMPNIDFPAGVPKENYPIITPLNSDIRLAVSQPWRSRTKKQSKNANSNSLDHGKISVL